MSREVPNIKYIQMVVIAMAVTTFVISCKGEQQSDPLDLSKVPVQVVEGMNAVQTKDGLLQMRMEAKILQRFESEQESYELFPDGFDVYAYNQEGLLETQIVSDNARHLKYDDGRETWEAFGNVVVKNLIKQEVMETDTLYWDQKNEKIYTHCYVKMYSPDGLMQGYGMESDQRARNSIIFNPFNSYGIVVQDSTEVIVDSVNFIGPIQKNR